MRPGLHFFGVMSLAIMVGAVVAYPVNIWLVARRLKHGMGTVYVLGRGGDSLPIGRHPLRDHDAPRPSHQEWLLVTVATLAALVAGLLVALRFGRLLS